LVVSVGRSVPVVVKCWNGCAQADVLGCGVLDHDERARNERGADAGEFERRRLQEEIERLARQIEGVRALYRRGEAAAGTIVETFLLSREITLSVPPVLRFVRHCPHRDDPGYDRPHYPAMVAPIVNVRGEMIAIHKTFLRPDGSDKADFPKELQRETCGPMKGGSVRLAPHKPGVPLISGEGLESVLSAMQLFRRPGWAALSASGLKAQELPPEVREVWLAGDNDESLAGQEAVLFAYGRHTAEQRHVKIMLPHHPGEDFNVVLRARAW
jgi:hypothetical protein